MTIIAMSTQTEPEGFRIAEGIDLYLVKPFPSEVLATILDRIARRDDS